MKYAIELELKDIFGIVASLQMLRDDKIPTENQKVGIGNLINEVQESASEAGLHLFL